MTTEIAKEFFVSLVSPVKKSWQGVAACSMAPEFALETTLVRNVSCQCRYAREWRNLNVCLYLTGNLGRHGIVDGPPPNAERGDISDSDAEVDVNEADTTDDEIELGDIDENEFGAEANNIADNDGEDSDGSVDLLRIGDYDSQVSSDSEPDR